MQKNRPQSELIASNQNADHSASGPIAVAPSKSQRKRDMLELQRLGEQLSTLSDSQLRRLDLPEVLFEAIAFRRGLRQNEALRRQRQYVGRLMRTIDAEALRNALAGMAAEHRARAIREGRNSK
jgi:ribosome-associated protein